MKILLVSIGTQGDAEPFLAIGEMLNKRGHFVICALPEQFRKLIEHSPIEFFSLGTDFIKMLNTDAGKLAFGGPGSGLKKILAYVKLARKSTTINRELINKQYEIVEREKPDRIVYNGKAIYPIIWGLNKKGKTILVSPVPYLHYVKNHTHVAFNSNLGPILNKLTFALANFGMFVTIMISIKWLKLTGKISRKQIQDALSSNKVIYTISPSLFPRPDYWDKNIKVLGYHELNKAINWRPPKELNNFLERHKRNRILFITFGSMTNPEPEIKTKIIIDILLRNEIIAIINTASGGLVKPDNFYSSRLFFVSQIPYNWILPKMYGVIHHGGSGTTHLGLKYGCATMIIPHIIDQFVWNKIIDQLGVGLKGIRVDKISTKNLEPRILKLLNNKSFKKKAEKVAIQMESEDFNEELYNTIIA